MQVDGLAIVRHHGLVFVPIDFIGGLFGTRGLFGGVFLVLVNGEVVGTKHHILRRHRDRFTVRGFEQVAGGQHQETGLRLRLGRQRHVHSHLVAVEVGVERRTSQRVQFDRAAFHQHRFKCLDTQAVQGGGAVEHDRMVFNHDFQRVPNLRTQTVHHLTGGFDVAGHAGFHQPFHNERFEQFDRHFFRQTALIHFQFRTDNDNRTAGIVHALTQQVLTETALFTFEHIRQRFQRAVVGAGHRAAATAVVNEGIHRLLQHTLFVAHDDVRGAQFQQPFQTVVTVDNPAIQIIQVGGGKTAAIQLHHRTDIRRNHRNDIHNHPLRTVAG